MEYLVCGILILIDEKDAAEAYDQKARELFGEFAKLNFPENNNDKIN